MVGTLSSDFDIIPLYGTGFNTQYQNLLLGFLLLTQSNTNIRMAYESTNNTNKEVRSILP